MQAGTFKKHQHKNAVAIPDQTPNIADVINLITEVDRPFHLSINISLNDSLFEISSRLNEISFIDRKEKRIISNFAKRCLCRLKKPFYEPEDLECAKYALAIIIAVKDVSALRKIKKLARLFDGERICPCLQRANRIFFLGHDVYDELIRARNVLIGFKAELKKSKQKTV